MKGLRIISLVLFSLSMGILCGYLANNYGVSRWWTLPPVIGMILALGQLLFRLEKD